MIKTVIFDLGGVYFTDGSARAIEQISATHGLSEESVRDVLMGDLGTRYRTGEIAAGEFWDGALGAWKLKVPADRLAALWLQTYEPIAGTVSLIDRLRGAGYELLYLSDNTQDRVEYLEATYGFRHRFADGVFSHDAGTRKPDPRIYEIVLDKASHPSSDCVYIDDKPAMLVPAEAMGMTVIAFENPDQVEAELLSHGLRF